MYPTSDKQYVNGKSKYSKLTYFDALKPIHLYNDAERIFERCFVSSEQRIVGYPSNPVSKIPQICYQIRKEIPWN